MKIYLTRIRQRILQMCFKLLFALHLVTFADIVPHQRLLHTCDH